MITDKLASYGAVEREAMPLIEHRSAVIPVVEIGWWGSLWFVPRAISGVRALVEITPWSRLSSPPRQPHSHAAGNTLLKRLPHNSQRHPRTRYNIQLKSDGVPAWHPLKMRRSFARNIFGMDQADSRAHLDSSVVCETTAATWLSLMRPASP